MGVVVSAGFYTIVNVSQNIVNQVKYGTTMTDLTTMSRTQGWYTCS